MKNFLLMGALLAPLPLLQGCFPIVAAGAVTGVLSVTDRRSTGMQVEDQNIELKAAARISERSNERTSVSVVSYNRRVLVYGQVPDAASKQEFGKIIATVPNVREVINELEISGTAGFGTASNDTFITTQVKASLIEAKDLQANAIKVLTERNGVYLMGLLTEREATRAAQIAAGVSGVTRVVKVFEIISEQELADINKRQNSAPQK